MTGSIVAKRYALALFQIALEQNILDQVGEELRVVKEVLSYNADIKAVLKSPKLSKGKKKEIIGQAFASLNTYVLNTLLLMVDRHRQDEIAGVADEFIQMVNDEKGIVEADVYSIRPLTDEEREVLSSTFATKINKKSLQIENIVDSNLLGGIKIRIGNRIYDGSLRGKLDRLQRKLLS